MTPTPRREQLEATVDLDAIAHNVRVVAKAAAGARVMPVLKADAYGHGAVPVARAVLAAGAAELGVATITEALGLRAAGIMAPVTTWLHGSAAEFGAAAAADVTVAVSRVDQLRAVLAVAGDAPPNVAVKIDSGLYRNGVAAEDWAALATALADTPGLALRSVFTHFACADEPGDPSIDAQTAVFDARVADLRTRGVDVGALHLANSAAALTRPDLARDIVRPGIAVYGRTPVPQVGDFGLRPAMTLDAEVIAVKRVPAGGAVSYGRTWIAQRDTTVALVPAGYADGVPRALSGRFAVRHGDALLPNVGRVCMDQFVVDAGDHDIAIGDRVVLFGGPPGPTAADWADTVGTIDYEILCGVGARAVRRYIGMRT